MSVTTCTRAARAWSAGRVIEAFDPDLFLSQESAPPAEHLPPRLHADLHRRVAWSAAEGAGGWGSAVYVSRGTLRPLDLGDFRGWLTGAEVEGLHGPAGRRRLLAFSLYKPLGSVEADDRGPGAGDDGGQVAGAAAQAEDTFTRSPASHDWLVGFMFLARSGNQQPLRGRNTKRGVPSSYGIISRAAFILPGS